MYVMHIHMSIHGAVVHTYMYFVTQLTPFHPSKTRALALFTQASSLATNTVAGPLHIFATATLPSVLVKAVYSCHHTVNISTVTCNARVGFGE